MHFAKLIFIDIQITVYFFQKRQTIFAMKLYLFLVNSVILIFFILSRPANANQYDGLDGSHTSITRQEIKRRALEMVDFSWSPSYNFTNFVASGYSGQSYKAGVTYWGMPYTQGTQRNRDSFLSVLSSQSGDAAVGNDCSGFVSIAWKTKQRYRTSEFINDRSGEWTTIISNTSLSNGASQLLTGDALVRRPTSTTGHIILVDYYNPTTGRIHVFEQTGGDGEDALGNTVVRRAVRNNYTPSWLASNGYKAIRRALLDGSITAPPVSGPTPDMIVLNETLYPQIMGVISTPNSTTSHYEARIMVSKIFQNALGRSLSTSELANISSANPFYSSTIGTGPVSRQEVFSMMVNGMENIMGWPQRRAIDITIMDLPTSGWGDVIEGAFAWKIANTDDLAGDKVYPLSTVVRYEFAKWGARLLFRLANPPVTAATAAMNRLSQTSPVVMSDLSNPDRPVSHYEARIMVSRAALAALGRSSLSEYELSLISSADPFDNPVEIDREVSRQEVFKMLIGAVEGISGLSRPLSSGYSIDDLPSSGWEADAIRGMNAWQIIDSSDILGSQIYRGLNVGRYQFAKWADRAISIMRASSAPEADLYSSGGTYAISSGDTTPRTEDGTDFGSKEYGSGSVTRTFRLRNTGTATLNTGSLSVSGASFVASGLSSSISAGGYDDFQVSFTPLSTGTISGTVSFTTNDSSESNYTFAVKGVGTSAATRVISLSGSLAFGNVTVGSWGDTTMTISNSGNSTLSVSSITYPGGFSGNWSSGTIAAGSSQNVTVTFGPAAATSYGGTITVYSDKTSGTNTISCSGTGTAEVTRIISLIGSLEFGSVPADPSGWSSGEATMTISNNGSSTLSVSSINYPSGFSGSWPGGTIAAGSTRNVTVTFTPTAATSYGGTITVNSDKTSGTNTISCSGTGTSVDTRIIGLTGNLAFGSVTVGSSGTATLTIGNTGNSALYVSSISYPSGFSGNWSGGAIASGSTRNVTVTFAPTAATSYGGTITVNSDKTSGTNTISCSGTGTAVDTRIIGLTGNLAFGSVTVGSTGTATLTIGNTGNSALYVSSISYPSGFSGNWSGGAIASGSTRNVTVTFAPTAATSYGGTITVNSDKTSGTNTISCSGTGTAVDTRIIGLTGNLVWGSVTVGSTGTATLTIGNTGNSALYVSSISYPSGFSGNWSGGAIASGSTRNVTITFAPTAATSYGGTITVISDKSSGTNTISCSGTGVVVATRVIALSGSLAFGNVTVSSSGEAIMTISNTGNSTLSVSSISYSSGFSGSWSGGTITAGNSRNVTVYFSPTSATSYNGTITVNSDKTSGPSTISCSGTGISGPTRIIRLVGDLAFGNVQIGSSSQRTLTICNDGNSELTISGITGSTTFNNDYYSSTVAPGGTLPVTVTFTPPSAAAFNSTITVSSDKTSGTNTITCSGTGVSEGTINGFIYTSDGAAIAITGYTGAGGAITIPATVNGLPVVTIGDSAFRYNNSLTSVVIPIGVTRIGAGAFADCNNLVSAIISTSVNSIGIYAFASCGNLANIVIPDGVTSSIGEGTFAYCYRLSSVSIGNGVPTVGYRAFDYCVNLTNVMIGSGVTEIRERAFDYCSSLASITIPSGVTSIENFAFRSCSSLLGANFLGNAPTSFGSEVFGNTAVGFTAYYLNGKTGFSTPKWQGYNSAVMIPATIVTSPASRSVSFGSSTTLSVAVSGTAPLIYQWYQGTSGTTTMPVGINSDSFTTPVLTTTQSYWVKVTNNANPTGANSASATVTVNLSSVDTLSNLVLSSGTLSPAFTTETMSYTANVSNATSSITVTPTTTDANATIRVNGTVVSSGTVSGAIALTAGGATNISIIVTAQDSTTKTYNVAVTRAAAGTPEIVVEQPLGTNLEDGWARIRFGNPLVGSATDKTITIRNAGNATLTGLAVSRSGANSSNFIVGTLGETSLAPGARTTFTVTFRPTEMGLRTASIKIASNDADENPFDIALEGYGVSAEIAIESPSGKDLTDGKATISVGSVPLGKTGQVFKFRIRNKGNGALNDLRVYNGGSHPHDFIVSQPKAISIGGGISTSFTVRFKPSAKGTRTAYIRIRSTDRDENPFDIRIKGIGTKPKQSARSLESLVLDGLEDPTKPDLRGPKDTVVESVTLTGGQKYRTLTLNRMSGHSTTVEVSPNLVDWYSGPLYTTVLQDDGFHIKVRDNTPILPERKRFIRIKP